MKVALITIHNIRHYGSVFQTYATQRLLEQFGASVSVVDYWRSNWNDLVSTYVTRTSWNRNGFTRFVYWLIRRGHIARAARIFGKFVDERLSLTPRAYHSPAELAEDPPQADLYCVGSDQVWNIDYNVDGNGPFYLEWVPPGKPKMSLASSIGKESLESGEADRLRTALQGFNTVSVRENSAANLVRSLGIEVQQVVDPVLAAPRTEWFRLADRNVSRSRGRVLVYQLNPGNLFSKVVAAARKRCPGRPVSIETVFHLRSLRYLRSTLPSPESALAHFRDAGFVVTDSFHGLALSLIFHKQFAVILPPKYSSRLRSLLQLTGTENRVIRSLGDVTNLSANIDYSAVEAILERERQKWNSLLARELQRTRT